MKVKIFSFSVVDSLEKQVNEFLETVSNVIDVKYSCCDNYSEVLILYEEEEKAAE